MPFIGIIAKESDSNFIKNAVIKNSEHNKFEFININRKSVENIKNIRFETIVINDELSEFIKSSKYLEEILQNAKYLIINSDIVKNAEILLDTDKDIITYGLNQEATFTISSIESERVLICLQRKIKNINGKTIEEQENSIEMNRCNRKKVCNSIGIFAILTIYGEKLKKI